MASGKEHVKLYLDVIYRRKWWILIPPLLSLVVAFGLLERLPKVYRASTTILVIPQRLPESFVQPTVTAQVEERLSSLKVLILSRTYLEKVVRELSLVPEGAPDSSIEEACARISQNIEVLYDRFRWSFFTITATHQDPEKAAGIANRLAELFIEHNNALRERQAEGTLSTVESWRSGKDIQLSQLEQEIAEYRRAHLWELPEQRAANIQLLSGAQQRVQRLTNEMRALQERDVHLQSQLQSQNLLEAAVGLSGNPDPVLRKLTTLKEELGDLRVSYTDDHPAVRAKLAEIAEFRRLHPEMGSQDQAESYTESLAVLGLKRESERLKLEVASLGEEREEARKEVEQYAARVDNAPVREQELLALTRDYNRLKLVYDELLSKKEQAIRGKDLETSKQGEQFEVQDRARAPAAPFKPDPNSIVLLCLFVGVGLGVGIALLLEFLDQSVRTETEFRQSFPDLSLLAIIPSMNDIRHLRGKKKSSRKSKRSKAAALLLLCAIGIGAVLGAVLIAA